MTTWARIVGGYRTLKGRLKKLFDEYGSAAIITWFTLFFGVLATFVLLMEYGLAPEPGVVDDGVSKGTWFAAYVATEATKPIRIVVTLALTPFVAQVGRRLRGMPKPVRSADGTQGTSPPSPTGR
jgi:hypothetical protein